jgi:hypothetical protein
VFDSIHPVWFSSWQRLVGTTTLLLVTFFTEAKRQPKNMLPPSRKIFLVLFGTGIFGYSLQTLLFNFGLNQSSASQAGICQPLTAVFTTLFAIAFKVRHARSRTCALSPRSHFVSFCTPAQFEKASWPKFGGIFLAMLGVCTMVAAPLVFGHSSAKTSIYGLLFFVGARAARLASCLTRPSLAGNTLSYSGLPGCVGRCLYLTTVSGCSVHHVDQVPDLAAQQPVHDLLGLPDRRSVSQRSHRLRLSVSRLFGCRAQWWCSSARPRALRIRSRRLSGTPKSSSVCLLLLVPSVCC